MPVPTDPDGSDWSEDRAYLTVLARVTLPPWVRARVDPSDVVQQALTNAVAHRDQLRGTGTGPRRAWLRQILVNVVRDAVRRHRGPAGLERSVQVVLDESSRRLDAVLAADRSGPEEQAQKLEDLRRLTDALARLPADQRTAVELKHLRGWTVRQMPPTWAGARRPSAGSSAVGCGPCATSWRPPLGGPMTMDRDAELDRLCAEYLEAAEGGRPPDRVVWLAAHPHLVADLADFLACLDTVADRAAPLRAVAGPEESATADFDPPAGEAEPFGSPPGYEILGELGRGGMGVVYKARQVAVGRTVAIKTLLGRESPEGLARFRAEAQTAGRLQHPNIVQVFEVGEHAGRAFITLEYVNGGTLAEVAGGRPQSPASAARTVETLARAVGAAHRTGIVYRDLKPSNVLLTRAGVPKVADFGLARRLDTDEQLTRSGVIVGTLAYMAPEQASGRAKAAGPAADVYALGAILYELLTGRPPFRAESVGDLVGQILGAEPLPPQALNPAVPRDVDTICRKALAKRPADRYASAGSLAEDLNRYLTGRPIAARPPGLGGRAWRWARRNPGAVGLGGVSAALLVVVLGMAFWGTRAAPDRSVERVRAAGELRIATDPNYPPMEYREGNGELVGIDIELGRRLAARLGVKATFVEVGWDDWPQMAAGLDAGHYDVIASTVTITAQRQRYAEFVEYLRVPLVFLCREGREVRALKDLPGKSVAFQANTTAQREIEAFRRMNVAARPVLAVQTREPFDALLGDRADPADRADVALVDEPVARWFAERHRQLKVTRLADHPLPAQPVGLAFRRGEARLRAVAEESVSDATGDPAWAALVDRWIERP